MVKKIFAQLESLSYREKKDSDLTFDLTQYISEEDFKRYKKAIELLVVYCDKYLINKKIFDSVSSVFQNENGNNVKLSVLIDIIRCYDGLNHPTSFNSAEGIALMMFVGDYFSIESINSYNELKHTSEIAVSLIDLIPCVCEFSAKIGDCYNLFLAPIIDQYNRENAKMYRILLYNFSKRVAEIDSKISESEDDWLKEILLLNDDDTSNDIVI